MRTPLIIVLFVLALVTPALAPPEHSVRQAIIKVRSGAVANDIADDYDMSVVDSIPELNRYLVAGAPATWRSYARTAEYFAIKNACAPYQNINCRKKKCRRMYDGCN